MIIKTCEMTDLRDWIKSLAIHLFQKRCMHVDTASSQILPHLDCHKINMGTNSQNPHGKNLDLRVKMCLTQKIVPR